MIMMMMMMMIMLLSVIMIMRKGSWETLGMQGCGMQQSCTAIGAGLMGIYNSLMGTQPSRETHPSELHGSMHPGTAGKQKG